MALYKDNYRAEELIEAIATSFQQNPALKREFIATCTPAITAQEYDEHIREKAIKIFSGCPLIPSEQELIPQGFLKASGSIEKLTRDVTFRSNCDQLLELERGPLDKNHQIKPKLIADWLVREGFFSQQQL